MPSRRISAAQVLNGFHLGHPVLTPELQHRVSAAKPGAVRVGGTPPVTFPRRSWGLAAGRAAAPQAAGPPLANTRGPQQRSGSRRGLSQVSRPFIHSLVPTTRHRRHARQSVANGNLSEPLTPFEGPDRSVLCLMGGYLSRPCRRQQSPALRSGDQPERTELLGPAQSARRFPLPFRFHSAVPSLDLARRLSYEDPVASPCRRWHRRLFIIAHQWQYLIQQAWCLFLGVFSSVPWSRSHCCLLTAPRCSVPQ